MSDEPPGRGGGGGGGGVERSAYHEGEEGGSRLRADGGHESFGGLRAPLLCIAWFDS